MKKQNLSFIKQYYEIRAIIYSLLIFSSLLFLVNIKELTTDPFIYVSIVGGLLLVSITEFLFSLSYFAKIYHKSHPLREMFTRVLKHHLFNIILLPVVQYISCAAIIYYDSTRFISVCAVVITFIFTYFTFYFYRNIYLNELNISHLAEDFFDASKYVSFAFIVYLSFLLSGIYEPPKFITAGIIGLLQVIYLVSAVYRKEKLSLWNFLSILIVSATLSGLVYFILRTFESEKVIAIMNITAEVVIADYFMTSLFIKSLTKKISLEVFLEYIIVTVCLILLLFFSI